MTKIKVDSNRRNLLKAVIALPLASVAGCTTLQTHAFVYGFKEYKPEMQAPTDFVLGKEWREPIGCREANIRSLRRGEGYVC